MLLANVTHCQRTRKEPDDVEARQISSVTGAVEGCNNPESRTDQ